MEDEYKESFDLFDKKEKGFLDITSSRALFNSFGLVISNEELEQMGGNKLTFDVFLNAVQQKLSTSNNDNIEKYFEGLVSKKTGKLSASLFKRELMNFGLKFSEQEADEILTQFKIDDEGNINWKEFCRTMK